MVIQLIKKLFIFNKVSFVMYLKILKGNLEFNLTYNVFGGFKKCFAFTEQVHEKLNKRY